MDGYPIIPEHYTDIIEDEDGATHLIQGIRIIRYFDSEGTECVRWKCDGETTLYRTLGMMDWASQDMFSHRQNIETD